ncbi:phosphotransferase [Moritella viscosa]|uniref:hydroxymethylglutaryl-CoA reductase (NADPH) n=1 Tax=Moritella viscosa TaxID=80854 RepID=A0ABY1HJW4_9GAMM|nr:phosphotransferase [Moritella viscosa]SGY91786.1 Peedicted hydroxymethylglutaryl-CoA reductase [Moritella viscosa]SGZ02982.1 Peedicted hydroxymethylglutaryl-CoA reductase [Moritella viscosa]SHO25181.1 Peedicted hydroxymethylglutaryl-CoA reductase [Moritella viscosa]
MRTRSENIVSYSMNDVANTKSTMCVDKNVRAVTLLNVSKCQLTLSCKEYQFSCVGQRIESIKISILGHAFQLNNLSVYQIDQNNGVAQVELRNETDSDTKKVLWKICDILHLIQEQKSNGRLSQLPLPKVPGRGLYTQEARLDRLEYVRSHTEAKLEMVAQTTLNESSLKSNIEALIGSVEIPLGVAGPLLIRGKHARGLFNAPMATSEGALIASATRGATALSQAGGVNVRVLGQRMYRAPIFVFSDLSSALFFADWVKDHYQELVKQTRQYSNYADLVEVSTELMGRAVHVQFIYETGDAAGQNMTTTCTWQACQWVLDQLKEFENLKLQNFVIDGNTSNDKKVTYHSFLKGRGIRVVAECVLTEDICKKTLKVTPLQLITAYHYILNGAIASGTIGININIANVIAAMFVATGQDIASVHESSIGNLHLELNENNDIYITLQLPSLVVGTVGGGTNLTQQRECLEILGCAGANNSHKLAEIITSFCLALDLSTLSALASDQFARAHEKMGRNRPIEWLTLKDLDKDFFTKGMQTYTQNYGIIVAKAEPLEIEKTGCSIICDLTAERVNKIIGHHPYQLTLEGEINPVNVMVKIKPLDTEVILMVNGIMSMGHPGLATSYNKFKKSMGFRGCHIRELAIMSQTDPRFVRNAPKTYMTVQDDSRESYILVQELMENMELMDSADDTSGWTPEHINAAIEGVAEVHAIWYGREDELAKKEWIMDVPNSENMQEKIYLWEMLGTHATEDFPEWFCEKDMVRFINRVNTLKDWYREIDAMPKTLIHNDFNPRNITFRREYGELRLCAYDWELATIQIPQHDLAELLAFTLQPDFDQSDVEQYIENHRQALQQQTNSEIDPIQWRRGFTLSLFDLVINRIPMYIVSHSFRHYEFMERVQMTLRRLLDHEGAVE